MYDSKLGNKIGTVEQYNIVSYQCSATYQGLKGQITTTDIGVIFETEEKNPLYLNYLDIININKHEKGQQIYHRLVFHLYPILVFLALLLWLDGNTGKLPSLLVYAFIPIYILALYFTRYWNFIKFDFIVDRRNIAELKFKLRFIDMLMLHSILRKQQVMVRSNPISTFETDNLN